MKTQLTTMIDLELGVVRTRLEKILGCSISDEQLNRFLKEAQNMSISSSEALDIIEKERRN